MLINKEQEKQSICLPKADEKILVVKRVNLFSTLSLFNGFMPMSDFFTIQTTILQHQEFHWRSTMENDSLYKQIIPYLVFEHNNTYFLMRRKTTASEQRLKDKYSLGIGGHIRQEDVTSNDPIDWACREFHEEVSYQGTFITTPLGLINDDSSAVGQVHIGIVFLLHGNMNQITIRDEHKEGQLVQLNHCATMYDKLEPWSQLVYNHLISQ
jgi:predicted NUDIX family phosphoesterase